MDIDEKMKELAEVFSKARKELDGIVKKNEQFVAEEIKRVEKAVREVTEECSRKQMDRLRDVKGTYEQRIKVCNDKAAAGLRDAKVKLDVQIEKTEALRNVMKQIVKECLETDQFAKCVSNNTREAVKKQKQITEDLNETVTTAENSATEKLKEAAKCHMDAQVEALKGLHEILKETKDCVV